MMELDNGRKNIYTCMCDWITLLYSRKLTGQYKPAIMEKIKIIIKKKKKIIKTERKGKIKQEHEVTVGS